MNSSAYSVRCYRRRVAIHLSLASLSGSVPNLHYPGNCGSSLVDQKVLLLNARSVNRKTCVIQKLFLDEQADLRGVNLDASWVKMKMLICPKEAFQAEKLLDFSYIHWSITCSLVLKCF